MSKIKESNLKNNPKDVIMCMVPKQRLKKNFYYKLGCSSSYTTDYPARDIFKNKLMWKQD